MTDVPSGTLTFMPSMVSDTRFELSRRGVPKSITAGAGIDLSYSAACF
jgi:hypothetical protein